MSGTSTFAQDVQKFSEKAKDRSDAILRAVCLELLNRVVLRSPVGNPDLWKANEDVVADRRSARNFARDFGKRISRKKLQQQFALKAGKTYVGGRFRGNWQVTIGAPATTATDQIDPSGAAVLAEGDAVLTNVKTGMVIYLVNNLPYAHALEYGHSTQAPAGIVRITVAEFRSVLQEIVRGL